jgi:hypothetical protein
LIRRATNEPGTQSWTPITSQPFTSWRINGVYKVLLRSGVVTTLGGRHNHVFTMFDYMAPWTRRNGYWQMYATSNGSFYLIPSLAPKTIEMRPIDWVQFNGNG